MDLRAFGAGCEEDIYTKLGALGRTQAGLVRVPLAAGAYFIEARTQFERRLAKVVLAR